MSNRNALMVVAPGVAIGCGILLGETQEPWCPPECDCEVTKAATKDCIMELTPCEGIVPVRPPGGLLECGDAHYYESEWPVDCEKSSSRWVTRYDEEGPYQRKEYDNWDNCNKVNTPCYYPMTCEVGEKDGKPACVPGVQNGNWGYKEKLVQVPCP